ncbi:MAG: hypothetical protein AB9900_12720 [Humidesulfovibrio sp.]
MAHRIDSTGATEAGLFTDGDPALAVPSTLVDADWLNMTQEELLHVIEEAGLTPVKGTNTQLQQALLLHIKASGIWSSAKDYTVPSMVFGSDYKLYLALLASGPGGAGAKDPTSEPTYWLDYAGSIAPSGPTLDEFYIDAGSMSSAITDGAASGQYETSPNRVNRQYMSFRGDTANTIAQFSARLPSNWDAGTVRAKLLWEPAAGASAGDEVRWLFSAVAVGNDDALDAAFGTPVNIDDAAIAAGDAHETPASAAMTIGGTPAVGDLVTFKIERDYDYGSQPLSEHARLLGMVIQYGVSGTITAW